MPTFYNFRENGLDYSFDDIFVPADMFRDGNLLVWGSGNAGRLGDATITNKSTPVTTSSGGTNWKQVSGGNNHMTAIKTDGTLWIWGTGGFGTLGNGATTGNISTPVTTFAGGNNWKQVSSGNNHTAAIKTDGTLWTWGLASDGRLGNGATAGNISTPVTTFAGGTNWKQVSCGGGHIAAIKTDGTLWTWGSNRQTVNEGSVVVRTQGQLGNAVTTLLTSTPVTTFSGGTNWKQVSCGGYHTAAIKTDGTLWIWGSSQGYTVNTGGQLGNGQTIGGRSTPVTTFAGGNNWKQVNCGFTHTTGIKTDGTLWIWGYNFGGTLGNAVTTDRSTPVTTFAGGNNWKQVNAGGSCTAAIKTNGTLWTWGYGGQGRIGNASTTNVSTPVTTFAGGTNWKQVSCGGGQASALTYIDPVI